MMLFNGPTTCAAISLFLLAAQAWSQPGSLTFDEALNAVRNRNEALMAAQDDVQIQAYERAAAKGLRYPKVEVEARHTVLNDPVRIGVDPIPFSLTLQDEQFDEAKVSASLPLYAGGRIDAANQATEAQEHEAQAQGRRTEEELVTQLAERYFGCCLARSNVDVQGIKVRAMERHVYQAQRLMEEGIIARVEYLNAKVALANARQEQGAAERDVSIVQEGLANVVVSGEPVTPASGLFLLPDVEPLETFQGYVEEGHPVLAMLDAKEDLARQGVRAEEGPIGPPFTCSACTNLLPAT